MKILHTEASKGWGGQEIRIFNEAIGMRKRGHEVVFAVQKGSELGIKARAAGFQTYELSFTKASLIPAVFKLVGIILQHKIKIINTHSSLDAWMGGLAGKLCFIKVLRTRHLSTPVKRGLNSRLLYNMLANYVVTTCAETRQVIAEQAKLPAKRIFSIPTGVELEHLNVSEEEKVAFRKKWGLSQEDVVAGTLCVLRGWKGVSDLLHAAAILRDVKGLKWLVIGGGVSEDYFLSQYKELKLEDNVIFTGHLDKPNVALACIDIFMLLSWANEGVSQASLQAAGLKKPLITTPTGGLKEVCIEGKTGLIVPPHDPKSVAQAVLQLVNDKKLREKMGNEAQQLVKSQFTFEKTLDEMEKIYGKCR
jgi:glycosyltransferase involved in cell wall biosynthesis